MKGLIIILILIGLLIFSYYKSPDVREKMDGMKDVFNGDYNSDLIYVGKPVKEIETDCNSKEDCISLEGCEENNCICKDGMCWIRKENAA